MPTFQHPPSELQAELQAVRADDSEVVELVEMATCEEQSLLTRPMPVAELMTSAMHNRRNFVLGALLLPALVGLAYVSVDLNITKAPEVSEGQGAISVKVEDMFTKTCSSCTGGTCQCGWTQAAGACANYDNGCCWHCCCNHMDRYQDGSGDWWQYDHPVGESYQRGFDCTAGFSNYMDAWSGEKKQYCCLHEGVGCEHGPVTAYSGTFNCEQGALDWQIGWSREKKAYCCEHAGTGCEYQPNPWRRIGEALGRNPVALLLVLVIILGLGYFCYRRVLNRDENARLFAEAMVKQEEEDAGRGCFGTRTC